MRAAALATALVGLLAACSPRFDWREIRQPEAGFQVALPGKPQTVVREIAFPGRDGEVRTEMTMTSTGVGASLFAVGSARLPQPAIADAAALEATLAWFRDGLLRNVQATSAAAAAAAPPAGLGGRTLRAAQAFVAPGRVAGDRPARLAARLYVVDDRLFQLVALGAEDEIPPQALETFFDSFRLLP